MRPNDTFEISTRVHLPQTLTVKMNSERRNIVRHLMEKHKVTTLGGVLDALMTEYLLANPETEV